MKQERRTTLGRRDFLRTLECLLQRRNESSADDELMPLLQAQPNPFE